MRAETRGKKQGQRLTTPFTLYRHDTKNNFKNGSSQAEMTSVVGYCSMFTSREVVLHYERKGRRIPAQETLEEEYEGQGGQP